MNALVRDFYRVEAEVMRMRPTFFDSPERRAAWDEAAFRAEAEIGPKHGPWLHLAIPPHLDLSNTWWWLPEEYGDDE